MKVMALVIMAILDTNSGGLHAIDMISLCTNIHTKSIGKRWWLSSYSWSIRLN